MTVVANNKAAFRDKPRAVLFDIDNTLYPYNPAHEAAMAAIAAKAKGAFGFSEDVFNDAFGRAREIVKARLEGTASSHNRLLYMQNTLELLGLKTQPYMALDLEQTYWRTFLASAELFPGALDFLHALRRAGIATAVVTDLAADIQFRKLIYFNLNEAFDYVVTSEEAGVEKPAAAPFEIALGKLSVDPTEAAMIGDNPVGDIGGAKALGIATAQKRHAGVKVRTDRNKPDLVFDDFNELARHLAGYGWLEAGAKIRAQIMTAPIIVVHRRNRTIQLNGLPRGCWIEIDIDLLDGVPHLSHDPVTREMSAERLADFLPRALERGIEGFILDCKRENAEAAVQPILTEHKIKNYFYLNEMEIQADMYTASVVTHRSALRIWRYRPARDLVHYAEEMKKAAQAFPAWAWIDCWQRGLPADIGMAFLPLNQGDAHKLQQLDVRLCICSPELYAHVYEKNYEAEELEAIYVGTVRYRRRLMQTGIHHDAVCTKFPWLWTTDIDLLSSARSLSAN